MKNRSGLTFIELVVVLLILGLVTAMVVPNFVGLFRTTQTGSAARRLIGYMRYLQDKAARENVQYFLVLDLGKTGPVNYWASDEEIPEEEMPPEYYSLPEKEQMQMRYPEYSDRFVRAVEMPAGVTIESLLDEDDNVTLEGFHRMVFYPDGTATRTTIYIKGPGDEIITIYVKPHTGDTVLYEGREEIDPLPDLVEED